MNGEIPLVSVDKTDGIQVYLSEKSIAAEIVTAKSSEMNILVPGADGEFVSLPLIFVYAMMFRGQVVESWAAAPFSFTDGGSFALSS